MKSSLKSCANELELNNQAFLEMCKTLNTTDNSTNIYSSNLPFPILNFLLVTAQETLKRTQGYTYVNLDDENILDDETVYKKAKVPKPILLIKRKNDHNSNSFDIKLFNEDLVPAKKHDKFEFYILNTTSLKSCAYNQDDTLLSVDIKPDDILIILIPSSSKKHLDEKICRIFTTATKDDKFLARKYDKSANVPPLIERFLSYFQSQDKILSIIIDLINKTNLKPYYNNKQGKS